MKLLWVVLCLAVFGGAARANPVKRDSPVDLELASPLEEIGGNFEGDMVITPEQQEIVKNSYTALIGEANKWPNSLVPYKIDDRAFSSVEQNNIVSALRQIELVSCVRFVPWTTQPDYVLVTGEYTGCWATLGHRKGMQTVNLQPNGCLSRGTIIHEFLHSLGFVHMHSAPYRDFYVDINTAAIPASKASNFEIRSSDIIEDFGISYDYDSVMHYGPTAFSVDNVQQTIIPKKQGVTIGQRVGMSYKDVKRLNYMYPKCY